MVLNVVMLNERFTKAVVCLIAIVLGALILAGLYALIDSEVMPTLSQRIKDMFDYTN